MSRHEDFFRTHNRVKEGFVATTISDIPSVFSLAAVPSGAVAIIGYGNGRKRRCIRVNYLDTF